MQDYSEKIIIIQQRKEPVYKVLYSEGGAGQSISSDDDVKVVSLICCISKRISNKIELLFLSVTLITYGIKKEHYFYFSD
jgi:hypothetical protein